jgi:alpha-N-acetylglucosaminidase
MGNIQKWGGPLSQNFISRKLELLKLIVHRMRSLGMLPVLPAFSGNVPYALKKVYPNVTLIEHPAWNGFNESYSTYMLEPTDPLFQDIGSKFMNEVQVNYITDI